MIAEKPDQKQLQYMHGSDVSSTYFVASQLPPVPLKCHDFLSYTFATSLEAPGRALVDTAAQHGLIGRETLEKLDQHLLTNFGMKVRHSGEDGGTVRGVCGAEERTPIAYVPIGIGGCSGLLRVQIVPGPVPCLIPAYLLTDMGSIIDMVGLTLFHTTLGVTQQMYRRNAGHVEVCITEYGKGFSMPDAASFGRSQVWSDQPLPNPIRIANAFDMRVPLEALLLALALGGVDSSSQCSDDCGPATSAPRRPSPGRKARTPGMTSSGDAAEGGRADGVFAQECHWEGANAEHQRPRRDGPASTVDPAPWAKSVLGTGVAAVSDLRSPQRLELDEVSSRSPS